MKKLLLLLLVIVVSSSGGTYVYAADSEPENSVETEESIDMFVKDIETGEETSEEMEVPSDESVLEADSYKMNLIPPSRVIIGDDERGIIPFNQLAFFPYSAIGRLTITYYDGSVAYGTGFLVGSNDVATAAHCLYNSNNSIAKSITLKFPASITLAQQQYTGTDMAIPKEYMDNKTVDYDWAVFQINGNAGNSRGYFGWTTSVKVGNTVQVSGFPSSLLMAAGRQITAVNTLNVRYDVDTESGQSGAPVFFYTTGQIVAIHRGGVTNSYNTGARVCTRMGTVFNNYRNK